MKKVGVGGQAALVCEVCLGAASRNGRRGLRLRSVLRLGTEHDIGVLLVALRLWGRVGLVVEQGRGETCIHIYARERLGKKKRKK